MKNRWFAVYLVFWLILTESLNLERIIIGSLICIGVYLLNRDTVNKSKKSIQLLLTDIKYIIIYTVNLIKEIIIANIHVAKIVLSPNMTISPSVVTIETKLKGDFNKVILANSITLTPGTITLHLYDNKYVVHCLDKSSEEGLNGLSFERILLEKEGLNVK